MLFRCAVIFQVRLSQLVALIRLYILFLICSIFLTDIIYICKKFYFFEKNFPHQICIKEKRVYSHSLSLHSSVCLTLLADIAHTPSVDSQALCRNVCLEKSSEEVPFLKRDNKNLPSLYSLLQTKATSELAHL